MFLPTHTIDGIPVQKVLAANPLDVNSRGGKCNFPTYLTKDGSKMTTGGFAGRPSRSAIPLDPDEMERLRIEMNESNMPISPRLFRLALNAMEPGIGYATDEFGNCAKAVSYNQAQICIANKIGARTLLITIPETIEVHARIIDEPR